MTIEELIYLARARGAVIPVAAESSTRRLSGNVNVNQIVDALRENGASVSRAVEAGLHQALEDEAAWIQARKERAWADIRAMHAREDEERRQEEREERETATKPARRPGRRIVGSELKNLLARPNIRSILTRGEQ